jgi:hypothetical protein
MRRKENQQEEAQLQTTKRKAAQSHESDAT